MPTAVKGFFKGLKFIGQIFENDKEPELQIGLPTDVKHVAHIGWESPSSNAPSWMNEFRTTPQLTLPPVNPLGEAKNTSTTLASKGVRQTGRGIQDSIARNTKDVQDSPRPLLNGGFGSPLRSPSKLGSGQPRPSRPHRSSATSTGSPTQDSSRSTRHSRRNKNSAPGDNPAPESKKSRRKKSKDLNSGGSTRPSKSKGKNPPSDESISSNQGPVSEHGDGLNKGEISLNTVTTVT